MCQGTRAAAGAPVLLVVLIAACILLRAHAGIAGLRITSAIADQDKTIAAATGDYVADGESFGFPRYRLAKSAAVRYLYRSGTKGTWTVTGSEANIAKNKGTIVSATAADAPNGLVYRYFSDGKWLTDESFAVADVSTELEALALQEAQERRALAAAAAAEARAATEAQQAAAAQLKARQDAEATAAAAVAAAAATAAAHASGLKAAGDVAERAQQEEIARQRQEAQVQASARAAEAGRLNAEREAAALISTAEEAKKRAAADKAAADAAALAKVLCLTLGSIS